MKQLQFLTAPLTWQQAVKCTVIMFWLFLRSAKRQAGVIMANRGNDYEIWQTSKEQAERPMVQIFRFAPIHYASIRQYHLYFARFCHLRPQYYEKQWFISVLMNPWGSDLAQHVSVVLTTAFSLTISNFKCISYTIYPKA